MGRSEKEKEGTSNVNDASHRRCCAMLEMAVVKNKSIHKLVDSIVALGCNIPKDFFVCRPCKADISGGFAVGTAGSKSPSSTSRCQHQKEYSKDGYSPQIVLCEDKAMEKETFEHTIIHELVHAYDVCRARLNFKDCTQHACTEIRASMLSGECSMLHELWRGQPLYQQQSLNKEEKGSSGTVGSATGLFAREATRESSPSPMGPATAPLTSGGLIFHGGMQNCVRRRAVKSLLMNPACNQPSIAEAAVDRAFERCYKDCSPFAEDEPPK